MSSGGLELGAGLEQDINQEELDFSVLFLYNSSNEDYSSKDDPESLLKSETQPPLLVVDHHPSYSSPTSGQDNSSDSLSQEHLSEAVFESFGLTTRASNIPAPSPRIEITPSGDSLNSQNLEPSPSSKSLGAYRDCVSPASSNSSTGWPLDTTSPVNSPCVSPPNVDNYGISLPSELCAGLQGIHTSSVHSSPGASPLNSLTDETFLQPVQQLSTSQLPHRRSRSTSPQGKRSLDQAYTCHGGTPVKQRSRSPSPIPSPHETPYFVHCQYPAQTEFPPQAQTLVHCQEDVLNNLSSNLPRPVPGTMPRGSYVQDCVYGEGYDWAVEQERMSRAGAEIKSETIYMLPGPHVWPTQAYHHPHRATYSGLTMPPQPSLEWPLPSTSGQYELIIQQQPRSHHRAHYETEGSRGAVKTPNGGHPEVQLAGYQGTAPLGLQVFIGTADERILKPHAFYQVHRITGKTVTTPSMERVMNGTKVLEIPLEPKNHMRVVIDCVGILKLRNADIELRNGETDIGRKNTRVRLVFRVHIPQPDGQFVSLQEASNPIECSQRSAQELPAVERQDLEQCSVLGGQQMVLTGQNFTSDSKVMFSEKTKNGEKIWEMEAMVDRDKTQSNMLFVEVPAYRDRSICQPAKVNFYVINGKKKWSQPQHFVYTPLRAIKAEPFDDYQLNPYGHADNQALSGMSVKSLYHHLEQNTNPQALNVSSTLYHLTTVDPRGHLYTSTGLDEPVYYQSRAGTMIDPSVMYHTPNQLYSNCSAALLPHAAPTPSQCVNPRNIMPKRAEAPQVGDSIEACLVSRHQASVQTSLPLGKSPPSRFIQEKAGSRWELTGQSVVQMGSARGNPDDPVPERVIVKQENLSCAYLEDVNDIIRRDMKGHHGD